MGYRSGRTMVALSCVAALVSAGCGGDTATRKDDSAAAEAKVASFSCPAPAMAAGADAKGPLDGKKLQVVTTVSPITSIVSSVGGDLVQVNGLIPEGADSHTFEPPAERGRALSRPTSCSSTGSSSRTPPRISPARTSGQGAEIVDLGRAHGDAPSSTSTTSRSRRDGGKPNPHLWTNPPFAKRYARIVARHAQRRDPAQRGALRGQLRRVRRQVDELDRAMTDATAVAARRATASC